MQHLYIVTPKQWILCLSCHCCKIRGDTHWRKVWYLIMDQIYHWYCGSPWLKISIWIPSKFLLKHCSDVIMSAMASQITGVFNVCSTVGSGADRRKYRVTGLCVCVCGGGGGGGGGLWGGGGWGLGVGGGGVGGGVGGGGGWGGIPRTKGQ